MHAIASVIKSITCLAQGSGRASLSSPHLAMKPSKLEPIVTALMDVELPDIRNDFDSSPQ